MQESKTQFDVVFVSSHGRHHWLARELAKNEWQVGHLDVSKLLGSWGEQDLKNPFGLSINSDLNQDQLAEWHLMSHSKKISNGVSLLLEKGPFEGSGPLKNFFKGKLGFNELLQKKLESFSQSPSVSEEVGQKSKLKNLSFEDQWLAHLGQQLASSIYSDNSRAQELSGGVPIFEDIYKDHSTRETRDSERFFSQVRHAKNFVPTRILTVEVASDSFFEISFEFQGAGAAKSEGVTSQKIKARVLIWALTSAQTDHLSKIANQLLFSGKSAEAKWNWQKFSMRGPSEVIEIWPIQFYMVEHLRLPWTHENLVLVSKNANGDFDAWMRLPSIFRFNADYHFRLSEAFKKKLATRFTSDAFEVLALPLESSLSKEQLGPSPWPIFTLEDLGELKCKKSPYLIFESCENLQTHQVQAQLRFQNDLFQKLTKMRKDWLAVEAKIKQRAIDREISMRK